MHILIHSKVIEIMNYRKVFIIQIVLFLGILVLSSAFAVEITDATNDILRQEKNTQSNQWVLKANNLSNYSYIDVTDIQYLTDEDFEVVINFLDSMDVNKIIGCEIFYGNYTNQNQYYRFRYTTETNTIQMTSIGFSFSVNKNIDFNFMNNHTQIRFNTTLPLDDEGFSIWGYTYEYSLDYEKYWADFFPSSYEPTDVDFDDSSQNDQDQDDDVNDSDEDPPQDGDGTDGGQNTDDDNEAEDTPGFELVFFCVSMLLILFVGIKRKI